MPNKLTIQPRTDRPADPFALLRTLAADVDRLFTGAGWPAFTNGGKAEAGWWPRLDVVEQNHTLVATVDLPGVKKEDVTISFVDGELTISGERKREVDEKTENYYRCERETGTFVRAIPLPDGVKPEQVKAVFTDGVLEVTIPLPAATPAAQTIAIADAPPKAA